MQILSPSVFQHPVTVCFPITHWSVLHPATSTLRRPTCLISISRFSSTSCNVPKTSSQTQSLLICCPMSLRSLWCLSKTSLICTDYFFTAHVCLSPNDNFLGQELNFLSKEANIAACITAWKINAMFQPWVLVWDNKLNSHPFPWT